MAGRGVPRRSPGGSRAHAQAFVNSLEGSPAVADAQGTLGKMDLSGASGVAAAHQIFNQLSFCDVSVGHGEVRSWGGSCGAGGVGRCAFARDSLSWILR